MLVGLATEIWPMDARPWNRLIAIIRRYPSFTEGYLGPYQGELAWTREALPRLIGTPGRE